MSLNKILLCLIIGDIPLLIDIKLHRQSISIQNVTPLSTNGCRILVYIPILEAIITCK